MNGWRATRPGRSVSGRGSDTNSLTTGTARGCCVRRFKRRGVRERGGSTHAGNYSANHLRFLLAHAFRAQPDAAFFVVLDGRAVVICDTIEQAVAATSRAVVSTIVWPERIVELLLPRLDA